MDAPQTTAPVLSTPDTHIFEDPTAPIDVSSLPRLSDEQVHITYEIARTVLEIRQNRWRRIALQFPDEMLRDAPKVYEGLVRGLKRARAEFIENAASPGGEVSVEEQLKNLDTGGRDEEVEERIHILADTSYGACCVDEVAAEHVNADVVVHYGRSCLSPTSRLPVVYVYTTRPLDIGQVVYTFKETYPDPEQKIVLMADLPYTHVMSEVVDNLVALGYTNIFATEVVHDPSSPVPNRTVPVEVASDESNLREYQIFHISDPPTTLLLILASRAGAIHIFSTTQLPFPQAGLSKAILALSAATLRRRYALLTSLSTAPVFGILINTLSVKHYLHMVDHVKEMISSAGKKYYTFVVGKVNAAKVANFSEIGGWVIIGCWESSLIESKDFYRPIITPFELRLALQADSERAWTGKWTSDFEAMLRAKPEHSRQDQRTEGDNVGFAGTAEVRQDTDSEEESVPPEYDLRTGRYVSQSRPMRLSSHRPDGSGNAGSSQAVVKRANGDVIHIGGVASPGAEYLKEKRTWQGLGSDFEIAGQDGDGNALSAARVEEGRSGIARGYKVASDDHRT